MHSIVWTASRHECDYTLREFDELCFILMAAKKTGHKDIGGLLQHAKPIMNK